MSTSILVELQSLPVPVCAIRRTVESIDLSFQRRMVRSLREMEIAKFTNITLDGKPGHTMAIEATYMAVVHPGIAGGLSDMENFVPVAEYGRHRAVRTCELGTSEDVRYFFSPELPVFRSGTAEMFPIVYLGREWGAR